jgi:hypothetical protein
VVANRAAAVSERSAGGEERTIIHRRLAALLALLVVGAAAVGLGLSGESPSKPGGAGGSIASGTASVERRDLVETDTEAGTLSYADPQTVYDRLSGTITWLPSVGQLIKPGETLFEVDGRPVVLMDGTTPAYRELAPGMSAGRDVLQLNRSLVDLGYDPDGIALDEEWQAATTAGVEELQASLGEQATGKLAFGQVVFLPGDQLVSDVEATLGGDGASTGSGNPSATDASDPALPQRTEYASLETAPPSPREQPPTNPPASQNPTKPHVPPKRTDTQTLEALIALLRVEIGQLKSHRGNTPGANNPNTPSAPSSANPNPAGPSNHDSRPAGSSAGGSPPTGSVGGASPLPVLQTTSTHLVVTVELGANKQSEAKAGEPVGVELPDGESVNGTITAVSAVAKSSNGNAANNGTGQDNGNNPNNGPNGSGSTIPVTIALSSLHTGAGLDQAAVSVNFAQARANGVLSVPVTALLATGGASYAVQEAAVPHRLIPVTVGLFAAGFVQISGPGIHPGLLVSDSQG